MTRKKDAETKPNQEATPDLDELLAGLGDNIQFDFDNVEWDSAGKLISTVARMGGMVSFYIRSDDGAVYISIRLGSKRKSYFATDSDQLNGLCEGLSLKLGAALAKIK